MENIIYIDTVTLVFCYLLLFLLYTPLSIFQYTKLRVYIHRFSRLIDSNKLSIVLFHDYIYHVPYTSPLAFLLYISVLNI